MKTRLLIQVSVFPQALGTMLSFLPRSSSCYIQWLVSSPLEATVVDCWLVVEWSVACLFVAVWPLMRAAEGLSLEFWRKKQVCDLVAN